MPRRNEIEAAVRDQPVDIRIEYSSGDPLYIGRAHPGAVTSNAVWQIEKITGGSDPTATDYANGTAEFDKVWDDRATYSY